MFSNIRADAKAMASRDPAARSVLEVVLLYPGFHAILLYRIAHCLYRWKLLFLARLTSNIARFFTGVEIHPGARIGKGLFIDHGMGIVIGETAEIGDNCTIYHGVTLGGTGKHTGKRHPTIGNNVLLSAGCKVLGPVIVGDNARIGANAVVLTDVDPDTTVVGVPGKAVKRKGERVAPPSVELDQVRIPDPVSQELCKIIMRLEKMEKKINIEQNPGQNQDIDPKERLNCRPDEDKKKSEDTLGEQTENNTEDTQKATQ
jgi:serine O-acetyltransferase